METRKVEYAPDYKSPLEAAIDEGRRIAESVVSNAEYQRLQSAALQTLKKWRANFSARPEYSTRIRDIDLPLARDVDALIAFEKQNGIGEE